MLYAAAALIVLASPDAGTPEIAAEPVVMGSLDRELIRQAVSRNRAEIRQCYEKQLVAKPTLQGKVAVKFVIAATGAVSEAKVAQSTVGNAELEQCIVDKLKMWIFPMPKGGGVVIVTYPFTFATR